MTSNCQNCNTPLSGNYCTNCGQSAGTHRINSHFLWHDIQHGLLHLDKGILFTTKELFTRPGHTVREFLNGKRVRHFKPISLVLVLAGIYGFLSHFFHINMLSNNIRLTGSGEKFNQVQEAVAQMSEWLSQHYAVFALIQIPIFSIGTYFAFRKVRYNFIEHLVINAFLTSQRLIVHILAFPLFYVFNETPQLRTIARITDLISYGLIFWSLFELFNRFNIIQRILRIALSLFISFFIMFLILAGAFEWVITSAT